jgi:hypothetical protein
VTDKNVSPESGVPLEDPGEDERRVRVRHASSQVTLYQTTGAKTDDFWWSARLRDISTSGLSLLANRSFVSGTILVIEPTKTADAMTRGLEARVVHVRQLPSGGYVLGCEFVNTLTEQEMNSLL